MRPLLDMIRRRLAPESGFTMITVMGAMMVVMLLSAVAIAAANGDLEGGARDQETKQALAAAEAGVNDYAYHLNQDNNYWAKCTGVPAPAKVNQPWNGANPAADPRQWRAVPASRSEYAIELLPADWAPNTANPAAEKRCDPANASASMIDKATGTFRIRVTGRVPSGNGDYAQRSVITSFRRKSFLDFLYVTDYETSDPAWYTRLAGGAATVPPIDTWATNNCGYWRDGRGTKRYTGVTSGGQTLTAGCDEIQFADKDRINGPFHTNDSILVCGSPTFGRTIKDKIEVSGPKPGWRDNCGGSNPNFVGTFRAGVPTLALPQSNSSLKTVVDPNYYFTGKTYIQLNGATMTVDNPSMGISGKNMALPPNGVVYVDDGICGQKYNPLDPNGAPAGCGNVYVKGTYSKDLTISAVGDVVLRGSVTKTNDSVLGLIAKQFVRVYHPTKNLDSNSCTNDTTDPYYFKDIQVDAAILALQHSFTVDSYYCGTPLGTLTVNGVIAQRYRGPVGTGNGGGIVTGYIKDYNYDDRLSLRQPPFFLDPVESSWHVSRQIEQTAR